MIDYDYLNLPKGIPVAWLIPFISSPYGAGKVSAIAGYNESWQEYNGMNSNEIKLVILILYQPNWSMIEILVKFSRETILCNQLNLWSISTSSFSNDSCRKFFLLDLGKAQWYFAIVESEANPNQWQNLAKFDQALVAIDHSNIAHRSIQGWYSTNFIYLMVILPMHE